jgi:hypothetical protein
VSLAIHTVSGNLLMPWLTSRTSRMNPVAVFVGVIFWGWLWGIWGLLLGIPITMVIKSICDPGGRPAADRRAAGGVGPAQPSCAFSSSAAALRISRESLSSFTARDSDTAPTSEDSAAIAFVRLALGLSATARPAEELQVDVDLLRVGGARPVVAAPPRRRRGW